MHSKNRGMERNEGGSRRGEWEDGRNFTKAVRRGKAEGGEKLQESSSIQYDNPTKPDAERDKTHSLQSGQSRDR